MRVLLACLLALSAFAHFRLSENYRSDSGIYGPEYAEIQEQMVNLSDLYEHVQVYEIGKTVKQESLYGLLIKEQSEFAPKNMVMITGAIHGNEYLNMVDRLMYYFADRSIPEFNSFLANGGAILVVPVVNPDGYDRRRRRNANNVDLNRDWENELINLPGFAQPESSAIADWVDSYVREGQFSLDLVIDYHCCHGSLLYPFGYTKKRMPTQDVQAHEYIADLMKRYFPDYISGITGEVLGYFPRGTTKDYWYLKHGALAFTFEGKYKKEQAKLEQHVLWWRDLLATFTY